MSLHHSWYEPGGSVLLDHNNLEAFSDPVNYDREDPSDTGVAFYCALAQEAGGSVLEIACGTGRVTIPIAKLGFPTTGLDIVPGMLEQAKSKSAGLPIRWVEADARTFNLHEQFRFIFLTGNAFQAFVTNSEQAAVLQCVRTHLHDEGLFAFETRNPLFPTQRHEQVSFPSLKPAKRKKSNIPLSMLIILLANYQKGGLEGEALQETFLCCFFLPASLAKRSNKEDVFGGLQPRWRVSQQYHSWEAAYAIHD